jgi:hypothetical protein
MTNGSLAESWKSARLGIQRLKDSLIYSKNVQISGFFAGAVTTWKKTNKAKFINFWRTNNGIS